MNKRIQELAKQAGDYVNEVYTPPVRSKTPGKIWEDGHVDWHTQFHQKFAELIVRENINLLRQEWYDLNNAPKEENATPRDVGLRVGRKTEVIALINKISNHFGIEQ